MRILKIIRKHHNLILSIIDIVQIINIFTKSTFISILVIVSRSVIRMRNDVKKN